MRNVFIQTLKSNDNQWCVNPINFFHFTLRNFRVSIAWQDVLHHTTQYIGCWLRTFLWWFTVWLQRENLIKIIAKFIKKKKKKKTKSMNETKFRLFVINIATLSNPFDIKLFERSRVKWNHVHESSKNSALNPLKRRFGTGFKLLFDWIHKALCCGKNKSWTLVANNSHETQSDSVNKWYNNILF
jgi:hypothetical protein